MKRANDRRGKVRQVGKTKQGKAQQNKEKEKKKKKRKKEPQDELIKSK